MRPLIMIVITLSIFTASCGTRKDLAGAAVENYLGAMVSKDVSQLSALSCADWEQSSRTEMDSFQAVDVKLQDVSCAENGKEGETTLVSCEGKLVATYGTENQEIDLSARTYLVVEKGGDWLICGER